MRIRYQLTSRYGLQAARNTAAACLSISRGPNEQALAEYGPSVVDRINISSGRTKPTLSVDAALGAQLYKTEKLALNFQADGENLNNRLNVIDFGGLFSGNAIGPPRSYSLRLAAAF